MTAPDLPTVHLNYAAEQQRRVDAARAAIEVHPASAIERFPDFEIESESDRVELALFAADLNPHSLAENFATFQISDRSSSLRITERVVRHGVGSQFIQHFGILDERDRVYIAEIAAAHDPVGVSRYIELYQISSENDRVRIASIAAKSDGMRFSQYVPNYNITSEADRLDLALLAAQSGGWETSWDIARFGLTQERDRCRVALAAAAHRAAGRSFQIERYALTDERRRLEVAKVAAQADGGKTAKDIMRYRISDQKALEEIAMICAATNGEMTSEYIEGFGLRSEGARVRIARVAAAQNGQGFSEYVNRYAIRAEEERCNLATIALHQYPTGTIARISQYAIRDAQRLTGLAKLAASLDGGATSQFISRFDISDPQTLAEIALIAASQDGHGTARNIDQYKLSDRDALITIGQVAVRQSLYSFGQIRQHFGFTDNEALRSILSPVFHELTECAGLGSTELFQRFETVRDWIKAAVNNKALTAGLGVDSEGWDDLEPHEKITRLARWIHDMVRSTANTPLFSEELHSYRDELQAVELVAGALAATIVTWNQADVERYGNRTRAALAYVTGYRDIPAEPLPATSARKLWSSLLHGYESMPEGPAALLPVSFATPPLAYEAIDMAATLRGLGGVIPAFHEPLMTNESIRAAIEQIRELIDERFAQVMQLEALEEGGVIKLLDRWGGDLTPFTVLAARFEQHRHWKEELPILREIAGRVIDGTFHDWRYRQSDDHVAALTPRGLAAWRENPSVSKVQKLVADNAAPSEDGVRGNARAVFESNLLAHVPEPLLIQYRERGSSRERLRRFLTLNEGKRARELRSFPQALALMRDALDWGEEDELKQLIKSLNNSKQEMLREIQASEPERAKQLSDDISTLKNLLTSRVGRVGESYRVFTTITDDPKLLLMTGDLVQCASCQNFRTGLYVDCLPGYVIDGNIKLALTYVAKQRAVDGAISKLSNRAQREHDAAVTITERFDHPRQALVFEAVEATSGAVVDSESLSLGYAFRREVLRLGRGADNHPVILTERPYTQTHILGIQIEQQQRELIAAFTRAVGAKAFQPGTKAIFPMSRNPAGVYSDAAGGRKMGPYWLG